MGQDQAAKLSRGFSPRGAHTALGASHTTLGASPRSVWDLSLWGQQTCGRGQGQQHGAEGWHARTDVCSYVGVLLAYLVGVQCLPVGLREGRHLEAERGVSAAPGAPGEGEAAPRPSSPSPGAGKERESQISGGGGGCSPQPARPGRHRQRVLEAARDVGLTLALPGGSDEGTTSLPIPGPGAHQLGEPREFAGDNLSAGRQELS